MSTTTRLPLLFSYRDTLLGNGFLVEVRVMNGRAMCVTESDGLWMYGVNPGGMAACGVDLPTAHKAFRETFTRVLIDIASESASFDEFQAAVDRFVRETSQDAVGEWQAAVEEVRRLNLSLAGLDKASADSPLRVEVSIRKQEQVTPEDNLAVSEALMAA